MTPERIEEIRKMIQDNPEWHRTKLSQELCKKWDWRGENSQIKDISCRDMLRALDAAGKITLPKQLQNAHAGGGADRVARIDHDTTPIEGPLSVLLPLRVEIVTRREELTKFKSYIEQYHYLGYDRNIGETMKYAVYSVDGAPLASLMFGAAAWACTHRDTHIGWSREQREASLRFLSNNVRFLIYPWVRVSHLASHVLSLICRRISSDWMVKYGHPVYCLETFVECNRFSATCYRAANWKRIGFTSGRGRNSKSWRGELPIKDIYLYPLHKRYKEKLTNMEASS